MEGKSLFYFFGDDEAYFRALNGEFNKSSKVPIDFKRFFESSEEKIQSFFLKTYFDIPACIFIDFSKHTQDYLHLARIIARTPMQAPLIVVGLVDYLSPLDVIKESIATGVNLTFIKSTETFDVVFHVQKLLAPDASSEHGFANATLEDDFEAGIPVKIGYVHDIGLHIETDYPLREGDKKIIQHHWLSKRLVPSKQVTVTKVSTTDLFYHFKYAVDLGFEFIDEFFPIEGMDEKKIREKKAERDDYVKYHKKQLMIWLKGNDYNSLQKKAKVLVIDSEFKFYNDQARTDRHPYTIRFSPFLIDVKSELERLRPQVIAFALDSEENPDPKNTNEQLLQLVNALKDIYTDNNPFLIVFNSKVDSLELKQNLSYNNIMSVSGELSVVIMQKMAEIFDKKLSETFKNKSVSKECVFLKKTNPASIAEILFPIKVVKLSELDMIFQTELELPIGKNILLKKPVNMYVNVQPVQSAGQASKVPQYHGLIHSIEEEDKQELRRFVNTVFFRDHDAQQAAEAEEYRKLNESKLNEKIQAAKAAAEAAAAEAEAEAAEKEPNPESNEGAVEESNNKEPAKSST